MKLGVAPPSRRVIFEVALFALAIGDALGSLLPDEPVRHWVLAAIAVAALFIRRRAPYLALLLGLPAVATGSAVIASMIVLCTIGERRSAKGWIIAACAAFFVCYTAVWDQSYSGVDTLLNLVYAIIFSTAPVWLGMLITARSELSDKLAEIERARRHEEELVVERALAGERAALAREMHDVVSHQVSLIAVQAGALQVTAADSGSVEAARTIRMLSVRTLDELREMVGVLRPSGSGGVELAPQPGLDDIAALVASSRVPTRIETVDDLGIVPSAPVQRAVYRTVQEGLTNIAKHAPGASATLSLRIDRSEVSLSLVNTKPTRAPEQLPSSQHGLLGLRERAELLGGKLSAGRRSDGGYCLSLTLPIHT